MLKAGEDGRQDVESASRYYPYDEGARRPSRKRGPTECALCPIHPWIVDFFLYLSCRKPKLHQQIDAFSLSPAFRKECEGHI